MDIKTKKIDEIESFFEETFIKTKSQTGEKYRINQYEIDNLTALHILKKVHLLFNAPFKGVP